MSTLKVNAIRSANGTGDAISLTAADKTCTANITNNLSNRNLIINGDCRIDQRNIAAGYSAYDTNSIRQYGGVDRFHQYFYSGNEEARYDFKRATGPADKGFDYCAHIDVTTSDTSWHADHALWTAYRVEANDCQGLYYGTSDAKDLTLSFWIKSKITGNFSLRVCAEDYSDYYVTTYTVSAADTWEKKIITIPGDTRAGKGLTIDNSHGIEIKWVWLSGTNRVGTPNQWATGDTEFGASGVTLANIFSSTSNYVEITGVQLEIGSYATDFEYRPYADELARCQRYFFAIQGNNTDYAGIQGYANSDSEIRFNVQFPVPMRATPTWDGSATACYLDCANDSDTANINAYSIIRSSPTTSPTSFTVKKSPGGSTAGQAGQFEFRADNGFIYVSAEF